MKIVIITSYFSKEINDPTLVNDLAQELASNGHEVLVYVQDWNQNYTNQTYFNHGLVNVIWQPTAIVPTLLKPLTRPVKWMFTSWFGWRNFKTEFEKFESDAVIAFAPAVIYNRVISKFVKRHTGKKLIIQWDFFPIHHARIGLLKGRFIAWLAMKWECALLSQFDYIGHMSSRNMKFFEDSFSVSPQLEQLEIPIWGPKEDEQGRADTSYIRDQYGLPLDKVVAIFGGQLSAGRGLEQLLNNIQAAEIDVPNCHFVIIGNGKMLDWLRNEVENRFLKNISLFPRVAREDYQRLLKACDIGLINTQGGTGVPTFPSKSIDYFRNSLPIIASIEDTTDFGDILESAGAGVAVETHDTSGFVIALAELCANENKKMKMGKAGLAYFNRVHLVSKVASKIVKTLQNA